MVTLLLERGASPAATDSAGMTALHLVGDCGHADIATMLLERGADPEATDGDGATPLDVAVNAATTPHYSSARGNGAVAVIEALVKAGVSVEGVTLPTGREDLDVLVTEAQGR